MWLDRNLGASRACVNSYDDSCTGWLYQWGRDTDGHQKTDSSLLRIEDITSHINVNYIERRFILSPNWNPYYGDWNNGEDTVGTIRSKKWSRTDGTSVCPLHFRVPTYQEFKLEYQDAVYSDSRHFLKSANMKIRNYYNGQTTRYPTYFWTNDGFKGSVYGFSNYINTPTSGLYPAYGCAVRCIQDATVTNEAAEMQKVKENSLEVFLASHIYDRTLGDLYTTYRINYLGNTSTVMLSEYEDNPESGFTVGLYEVVDGYRQGDIVVAFGGTSAADRQNASNAVMPDVLTDLNLLNFSKEDK